MSLIVPGSLTETDIVAGDISNWNTAYGWGNHAVAGYLDDYEEGTFTPSLTTSGTSPTVSYGASNKGVYVKIERLVYFNMVLDVSSRTGGSGQARVGGLPFTLEGTGTFSQNYPVFPVTQWGGSITPTYTNLAGRGAASQSYLTFRSDDSTGSTDELIGIFPSGSASGIRITGSYITTT